MQTQPLLRSFLLIVSVTVFLTNAIGGNWPGWRGPTKNGLAETNQFPPTTWSESENVLWKTAIPGRGHASPTIWEDSILLPTADEAKGTQSVLCFDRQSGVLKWEKLIHSGNLDTGGHDHTTQASATIATDGKLAYVSFLNNGGIYTTALTLAGELVWRKRVSSFVTHQGFGSSPHLYKDFVIVATDNKGGGVLAALDKTTGDMVWKRDRPKLPNYTSPVVLDVAGQEQLLLSGCELISSFNPNTGKTIWEIPGSTTECVVAMVTDGERVFTGGGYPTNHTVAIEADGSGEEAWKNNTRVYVTSLIVKDSHVYAANDAGFAICWNSRTGEEMWKERLTGSFFSSPTLVGNTFYSTNIRGTTFVFKGTPDHFELIAKNQLGDECYASPVICDSRIYLRIAHKGKQRQEFLTCIGKP